MKHLHFFLFTCARPGRSKGKDRPVPDDLVHRWVQGLPGPNTAIVSLLGRKHGPKGASEFTFYSFCGGVDSPSECKRRPSLQEWLDRWYRDLGIQVHEHPTFDFHPVPQEILVAVAADIHELLSHRRTVVVVDSGGETRIRDVCKHMGAREDFRTHD